jgi:type I restriction enzyme S subunit
MNKEMTTLGDSCQFFNGKAHEKDIDVEGDFVVVNSKFISRDGKVRKYSGKQMFALFEDDIVMVMSDVPNGKALAKCYIIEENDKYSLNQRICAIRTTEFNIGFLYYQLNRHPYFLAFNNGENQSNLRKGDILNCPLWKPSLEEQKQIVALLDKAFTAIDQAKANIEKNIVNAKELFQSKLNTIFSQKGDGWEEKTLGEICEVKGGKRLPKGDKLLKEDTGYPYIRARDLKQGTVLTEQLLYLDSNTQSKIKRYIVKEGDIYITIVGAKIGDVGIIPKELDGANLTENAAKIVLKENLLNKFLLLWLKSTICQNNIKKSTMASAQGKLALMRIKNLPVLVVPIETQKQITLSLEYLLSKTNKINDHYRLKLVSLEELKKSILQKAFSGELTQKEVVV